MNKIKTYQDLTAIGQNEANRMQFVLSAINDYKSSDLYKMAHTGKEYATGQNTTIKQYQKVLYTLTGQAVPDNYTANHKCASQIFKRFITQETAYLLGNGVTFSNEETKKKLGKEFDNNLYRYVKSALAQSVSYGFFNLDKVVFFNALEFVPLYDEENGGLMAGIRFWQVDGSKPLRATLYEIDGYTDYIKTEKEQIKVLNKKRTYKQVIKKSAVDGTEIYDGDNYPSFPIVPLWANTEKQSELVGIREQIDCYDLIKSGFANDLDDASMIYWTLTNAGGMDDVDLAQFVERMKTVKAAVVDGDDGVKAEAHTIDVPYQSREAYLSRLEKDLYKDFMALDTEQIAAGNVTATQIEAAYEPLNEKTDELEMCVIEFINGILEVAGIKDNPTFKRSQIVNKKEETELILMSAEYLDEETILNKLPFLTPDEVETVLEKRVAEESNRYKQLEEIKTDKELLETKTDEKLLETNE